MAVGSSGRQWPSSGQFFAKGLSRLLRVLGALVVGGLVTGWLGRKAGLSCSGKANTIMDLELAGTVERSEAALAGCSQGAVHAALLWDLLLIVWYVSALAAAVLFVAGRWLSKLGGYRLRKLRGAYATVIGAAVAAGVLDLVENGALAAGLHGQDGSLRERSWAAATAATAGWAKFTLTFLVLTYVLLGLLGWLAMPARNLHAAAPEPPDDPDGGGLGICLSGGGVRAGTFGLGVLQVLDRECLVDRARWLSSVSGGSYMAGAWAIARRADVEPPTEPPRPWSAAPGSDSPEVSHLRRHLNYLVAREGRLAGAIATLLVGLAINVTSLFLLLWLLARPLGWLVGWLLGPRHGSAPLSYTLDRRFWLPVAVWGALSVATFVLWVLQRRLASVGWPLTGTRWRSVMWRVALGAAAVAALLAFVLVAAPLGTVGLPSLIGDHAELLRLAQVIAGGGVAATVVGVLRKPLGRAVPRLGGLLVLLLAIVAGTEIAGGAATRGPHADMTRWLVVLAVFALWYYVADPDWWSLQPYYRARLREAFATRRTTDGSVESLEPGDEPELASLGRFRAADPSAQGPELLVCTTMNVTGNSPTRIGVPAYSFTFSPGWIRFHVPADDDGRCDDYAVPTAQYAKIFRRWDTPRLTAMTAVGMSGAAVSSAMGRFNYGSTKALLALANVRLGMWMPNPRLVPEGPLPTRPGYPRRRISYLVKEMFGVYDSEDLYLYITDGGHWENLGLVELVRRGCREIVCVDASGSNSISFATIAEAITLAAQELGTDIELPYEPLRAGIVDGRIDRTVPRDCAMGLITYPDGRHGVLWYLKASLMDDSPTRLLSYKEKNEIFPCDPTSDQLFDTEQFEVYRLLGEHVARHVVALRRNVLDTLRTGTSATPLPVAEDALVSRIDPELKAILLAADATR
jgi:hypothetical protein